MWRTNRLTRDGTAEPVSRDQILRHGRGQGKVYFPCLADHEQDWQPCPVDPFSAMCDNRTYTYTVLLYFTSDTVYTAHLHPTKSGCGKREAEINWSMVIPEKAPVTRTTLRTTGPMPADSLGSERHRYANASSDKLGTDPMAVDCMNKWTPLQKVGGIP